MLMRRVILTLAGAALAVAAPANATPTPKPPNPPTLHGFCSLGNVCTDNGTNTPTGVQPPTFAFASSGGSASGTLWIDILLPDNLTPPSDFTISGALSGTANLFSSTPWTTGDLDTYLGISASPTNPIGAYLPATQVYQPSAGGFYVYSVDLGSTTLLGTSGVGGAGQDSYLLTLGQDLAPGSYIVGFLAQTNDAGTGYGATANSGAILETGAVPEPGTWGLMLLGFAGVGVALRRSRKRTPALMQIA